MIGRENMPEFYISEEELEHAFLDLMAQLGYIIKYGPDIAPGQFSSERDSLDEMILSKCLLKQLRRLNPQLSEEEISVVMQKVLQIPMLSSFLTETNEKFHELILNGLELSRYINGEQQTMKCKLIDFDCPENNEFWAVNQFEVLGNSIKKRPDIIVFLNGIPVVVFELKNSGSETVDISNAYQQLQTYHHTIPALFTYNAFEVISDGINSASGTITSDFQRFMSWKSIDGVQIAQRSVPSYETLINGMFPKARLLDILQNFIIFQNTGKKISKVLAAYHQYFAVNKAIIQTLRASSLDGNRKIGTVWHTQGSGKSLSMVFYAKKLIQNPAMKNPTLVVITDRNDLDDQLYGTFLKSREFLQTTPQQANSRMELRQLLNQRMSGGIIFTTIQKFVPDDSEKVSEPLTNRNNVIVIADEAHRSQYGFQAKLSTNEEKTVVRFGYAHYLRNSLPNASYIGFTGTPVDSDDHDTISVFGNYIDIYDMSQSVADGATVKIYYDSRMTALGLREDLLQELDDDYQEITENQEIIQQEQLKSKWTRLEAVVASRTRLNVIARDIVTHFQERQESQEYTGGKGMIVAISRRAAVTLYEEFEKVVPDWCSDDPAKGKIKVVMTGSSADPLEWQKHIGNKASRDFLARRLKDPMDELQLVIVRDMWLTGFDVPSMHTMYIDKPMQGHNLMQAIARVNRVFQNKSGGLIVDYIGIYQNLKKAIQHYSAGDRDEVGIKTDEYISVMLEKYQQICELLHHYSYSFHDFASELPVEKLRSITRLMDYVLSLGETQKNWFMDWVSELSRAWSLCATHESAQKINIEVGLFKAVRAGILKYTENGDKKKSITQLNERLSELVSQAVVVNNLVDIMGMSEEDHPDISILSDMFLSSLANVEQKNLAVESLHQLLKKAIRDFRKTSQARSKQFSELLQNTLEKYRKQTMETGDALQKLILLAKTLRTEMEESTSSGFSTLEIGIQDIMTQNHEKEVSIELIQELATSMEQEMSVDWKVRSDIRARMKMKSKRILRNHGYNREDFEKLSEQILLQCELSF